MKELLEKISSYNLFNYLLPGVLFIVIIEKVTAYRLIHNDVIVTAIIAYFVGMVISRIGSLIVEALLRKMKFVKFANYNDFIEASKKDDKLNVLSEQNNTYRSLIAMILLLGLARTYEWLGKKIIFIEEWSMWLILLMMLILFLISYRKQTEYITKRIKKNLNE